MGTEFLCPNLRLLVNKGPDDGKVFESNHFPIIIGREAVSDFVLSRDSNVSRKHASLGSNKIEVWVEDLNSTNGTFVNNIRIHQKTPLCNGSIITLGSTHIKVVFLLTEKDIEHCLEDQSDTTCLNNRKMESFFVLDQVHSSQLADKFGDEALLDSTENMNKIVVPIFNTYKAQFIKGTGDGFFVTFSEPTDCYFATRNIMKKIKEYNQEHDKEKTINVRIGLNYGQCLVENNGDRHGQAVIVAFRIEGIKFTDLQKGSNGISKNDFPLKNRVFLSDVFYRQLPSDLQTGIHFIGKYKLKGIEETQGIYCHDWC